MDRRTKRQKLQAMADQAVSPQEAEVAKEKLKSLPPDPPPIIRSTFRIFINGLEININEGASFIVTYREGE